MRILLPSLLFLTAACVQTPAQFQQQAEAEAGARAALDTELVGLVPGKPQSCVNQPQLRDLTAFGDTLVYRTAGSMRYVNRTSGGCGGIGTDSYLVTRTPSTSLCRGDIAQAVDRTSQFPRGSCSFGDFVPYTRP